MSWVAMAGRLTMPPSTPMKSRAPPARMAMTGADGIAVPTAIDRSSFPEAHGVCRSVSFTVVLKWCTAAPVL